MDRISTIEEQINEESYELCEKSFRYFFKKAWSALDPEPYLHNWHIDCICEHLQAQAEGEPELQNMIVNVQPRLGKSKIISVGFPAWRWLTYAAEKFVCVSHSDRLTKDLTSNSRQLITSPWYANRWIGKDRKYELRKDSNTVTRFDNTVGGYRFATTPGGAGLGFGYSHLLMDDPNDLMDIYSEPMLTRVINFYKGVLRNRINNANTGKKTLVQQRLSESDLTQWLLEEEAGKWFHLVIPSEYDKKWTFISPIGSDDPREKDGELVCPNRFDDGFYDEEKKDPYRWAALYQQKPTPSGGAIIKTNWIQFYHNAPIDQMEVMLISADLALEDKDESDYCVFTVWGKRGSRFFLIDMIREKLDFQSQLSTMMYLDSKYPKARTKLVEKKATGSPLMNMLQNRISGLIAINPIGSKIERLFACVPEFVSGNVMFPYPDNVFWINDVLAEVTSFPKGKHDDIVDSVTMALNYLALQNAQTEAYMFDSQKDSIHDRLTDFNRDVGSKYDAVVYSKGSVRKIFTW